MAAPFDNPYIRSMVQVEGDVTSLTYSVDETGRYAAGSESGSTVTLKLRRLR